MRAVVLWPGDPQADPPRPTFIGTDAGTVIAGAWSDTWGALRASRTTMARVQLMWLPDAPIFDVQTHVITDSTGGVWAARAVYIPRIETWFAALDTPRLVQHPNGVDAATYYFTRGA